MTNKYLEKIAKELPISTGEKSVVVLGSAGIGGGIQYATSIDRKGLSYWNHLKELKSLRKQGLTPDATTAKRLRAYEYFNPNLGKQLLKHRIGGAAVAAAGVGTVYAANRHYKNRTTSK